MVMRPVLLLLLVCGCGDVRVLVPAPAVVAPAATITAPERVADAGSITTTSFVGPELGPPCCDAAGQRVSSATCAEGACSCSTGVLCACAGTTAQFLCTDACGSDAFADPVCAESGWACDQGLRRTDSCAEGTCWGEPGDCCVNPRCVDGRWSCDAIADGGGCW